MEIPLLEPGDMPVPPDQVRIRTLEVEPTVDGRRLKLEFALTPFQEPPEIDIVALDAAGEEIASTSVIHPTHPKLALTLHLRIGKALASCRVRARVRYAEQGVVAELEREVELPGPS
jgi:hypothetical protein